MSRRGLLILWAPVVAYATLLYVLAIRPDLPAFQHLSDKLLHTLGYAPLGLLALRAFHGGLGPLRPGATLKAFLATVGFGAFSELSQLFLASRSASGMDVVADAGGFALAAAGVYVAFHRFQRPGKRSPAAEPRL